MHFNIYLDDNLGEKLIQATKASDKSRNALIREAIDLWLRTNNKSSWPKQILDFKGESEGESEGESNFPAFESHRNDLKEANEDPFA